MDDIVVKGMKRVDLMTKPRQLYFFPKGGVVITLEEYDTEWELEEAIQSTISHCYPDILPEERWDLLKDIAREIESLSR